MTTAQQQQAARNFAAYWKDKGYEKGESQPFWLSLLRDVYGVEHPEQFIQFEEQVHLDHTSFIDGTIPATHVLIEQKGLGKDLNKPINWKRQLKTNGAYGCMGDLGIHTQHLPFRLGFRVDSVSAQLANLVPQRPCGDGFAPCETYDNAILLCGAHNAAGDRFPMVMEMKRMAPGCTNTVEYEIYGLDGSAKFSTEDANAVWYTRNQGREQAWSRLILGQRTLFPVITGGIFEFGFSDAMLQMFAAFIAELCGEPCAFGCFRPDEALLSHQLLTGALRAYETGSVVRLD